MRWRQEAGSCPQARTLGSHDAEPIMEPRSQPASVPKELRPGNRGRQRRAPHASLQKPSVLRWSGKIPIRIPGLRNLEDLSRQHLICALYIHAAAQWLPKQPWTIRHCASSHQHELDERDDAPARLSPHRRAGQTRDGERSAEDCEALWILRRVEERRLGTQRHWVHDS